MKKLNIKNTGARKLASLNVLLTGATGGIGQAAAKLLFELGANLVLVGRNQRKLDQLTHELRSMTSNTEQEVFAIKADITNENDRQRIVTELQALPFSINTLINNAGISQFELFERSDAKDLENVIVTNTIAPMQLTQQLLPLLMKEDSGKIINIGSTFGSIGFPGYTAYCASKYAIRGFSESLGRELADTNIVVKYLSPRATSTSINTSTVNEMNKALKTETDSPELVANELVALLTNYQRERYIGWPERVFVKINQLFPSIVTKSIVKQLPVIKSFALKY